MKSKLRKTRHGRDQGLQVERIRIRQIRIPKGHRAINEKILPGMKQSIDRFGVREPIWVRPLKNGGHELVVGLHRLQVLKESGERWIDCLVTTDKKRDRKAWATSENLHRAEYDPAQRAKAVKDWRKYLKQIGDGQEAQLGGRQPKDKGISRVAQAANMSRRSARRALDVAEVK